MNRNDFMHALEHDTKPLFGSSQEEVERLILQGIIPWGQPVAQVLEEGEVLIKLVKDAHATGLVTVLLEGSPKTGKTAIAAKLALSSGFPFIKLCSPENIVGYTETAKCQMIRKVFDDAYKSPYSCIIVDNIERLLDYSAIGQRYSNLVLQALLVLLNKQPPKNRRLLVICTTSRRQILEEMELLAVFSDVLHLMNLNQPEHLMAVINHVANDSDPQSFTREERARLAQHLTGRQIQIGIKSFLNFIEMARQFDPMNRLKQFEWKLEEAG